MSIKSALNQYLQSRLYKLVLQGKVIGIRMKIWTGEKFEFYDFSSGIVPKSCLGFLKKYGKTFEKLPLLVESEHYIDETGKSMVRNTFLTEDEKRNKYMVGELSSEAELTSKLEILAEVYDINASK